jgi:predicted dehydrogenase
MDGHVHHVAFFHWLTGRQPIESVTAEFGTLASDGRVEDTGVTLLRTPTVLAEIAGSNRLQEPNPQNGRQFKEEIQIFGSAGTIHIRPTERPSLLVYSPGAPLPEGLGGGWLAPRLEWVPFHERGRSVHFNADEDPWVGQHRHFVQCVRAGRPCITDGHFGRAVLEVLMAAYRSGREGRRIHLPLES